MCEKNLPVFATGVVLEPLDELFDGFKISVTASRAPSAPGQFFMLRKKGSDYLLGRPISVYRCRPYRSFYQIEFIIMEKGGGTKELGELYENDEVELLGPLGNGFPMPEPEERVCLVSGGVGVAPIANLASELAENSYDFYACFRDLVYGLDYIHYDDRLIIATEDGSEGVQGMLPAILTAETLKEKGYTVVYACGPVPMLKYVQSICKEAGVKAYFSMENRMACGVGACLGCTIKTTEGNKRCCKDGPVFPAEILIFEDEKPKVLEGAAIFAESGLSASAVPVGPDLSVSAVPVGPDLSVEIAGVKFKNPVIAASGTFGYGVEYEGLVDPSELGGICSKGLTLEPRAGNAGTRIHELSCVGMMNSIGLENPGIEHFIEHELPRMLAMDTVSIVNLSGSTLESYVEGAKLLDATDVEMIELNISCPNVKAGGMAFGMTLNAAREITCAIKEATGKPLMVKLTPNAPNLVGVALAVKEAGADAISLVNTFQALAIDIETGKPVFDNVYAGYSGPGIKPIALRMVHAVAKAIRRTDPDYPIVGLGGITNWRDAIEFIMAGATAVQVGTATFANPETMSEIVTGIREYMEKKRFGTIGEFRGIV